jgi:hypothetical protein
VDISVRIGLAILDAPVPVALMGCRRLRIRGNDEKVLITRRT